MAFCPILGNDARCKWSRQGRLISSRDLDGVVMMARPARQLRLMAEEGSNVPHMAGPRSNANGSVVTGAVRQAKKLLLDHIRAKERKS